MRLPGPLAGRTLGEFTVGELLGEGAHGVVHRAAQRGLDREVVIKVLRARATDERAAAFLREAQLAARLDHPYAAHVYASGVEPDGLAWIAMELVRGTTLADVLALQPRGRMPVARWVGLLDRICEVVHTAHEQGIVHRDLKPANIMVVARAGRLLPKLLDLGVAALVDERSEGAVGTPAYMAPEQGGGEDIDARADIYALGVMTWEALTGVRPFAGATLGELAQVRAIGPTWPADLPAELGAAVRAALGDRDARPATALAFAAAVRDAAGIRLAADALPRLDDGLRAELAWLPQPIAEAVGAIERARNPHQARDALWAIVDVAARWLGVLALAARRAVGPGPGGDADAPAVVALVRALHRRELADEEWLALARGLAGRFAAAREAYPIPELVDLALAEASPFAPLIALRAAELAATSEETLRAWLARTLPLVTALVRALAFLADYQLVVPRADGAELWIGARAARRAMMHVTGELALGEPALVDFDGRPVLALAPLVAIAAPAPGARDELFLFAGPGRGRGRGARLVAVPDGFERHDDDVWAWMRAHLLGGDALAARPTDEAAPYRGLAAFTAADADRFVGRERQADALLNRLLVTPLVAVVGPSGAGKSSFVQAGLVPRLPAGWRAVVLRPGHAPLAAFARVALDDAPLVIVVDQFEELFTLGADADERERFAAALVAASRRAQVRVVLTVRDDFLARAGALPALRDQLAQGIELVATPSADELVRILTEPARRAGYDFDDPELPTRMVRAVAAEPGALALLSFTAARLWELRDRAFHRLTRAAYEAIGGVEGALAAHAEAVLAAGTLEEQ
ncbi:MAG: protein kinase, partial [Deltaproteobacteria bacterium]|nr:protein kinase [Deltaproteobacteria bacterium]